MDKFVIRKNKPSESDAESSGSLSSYSTPSCSISAPNDISELGQEINQVKLKVYPRKNGRGFREDWYKTYTWLEYSPSRDAVFCYACRQFNPNASKETVFTIKGFNNWKKALCKNQGLPKHATTDYHLVALQKWAEKRDREANHCEISTLLNDNVLEKRRYYMKSLAEVVQFLAVNELPLRGDFCLEEGEEHSLFVNLFKFILKKDEKLAECNKIMPENAKYTSPEIQNEVIAIMAEMVKEDIISDVLSADVPWFSLLEDGTRDKNNRENVAIGIRYVKDGKANESLLSIKTSDKFDAKAFTELTMNELQVCGLPIKNLLSQCFDGASVMSGGVGGVQTLIKQRAGRDIPYIHCANHRLHLVVMKATNSEQSVQHFFEQCGALYCFLKNPKVDRLYKGQHLVRLLPQRWSGHLQIIRIIYDNFQIILSVLEEIQTQSSEFNGEDVVQSVGLSKVMKKYEFRFILVLLKIVLETLEPANKILRSRDAGLTESYDIIKATISTLSAKRNEGTLKITAEKTKLLIHDEGNAEQGSDNVQSPPISRRRKLSAKLSGFILTGKPSAEDSSNNFKRLFYAVIDIVLSELDRRFSINKELLTALAAENLEHVKLHFLKELGITIPSIEEILVVQKYLQKFDCPCVFEEIYKQKEAFHDTYQMLATVKTFPCSTTTCESTFSVLTHIDSPRRRSMSCSRQSNLTF